jgi:hypothetical protein
MTGAGAGAAASERRRSFSQLQTNARQHPGFPHECRFLTCNMRQISFNSRGNEFSTYCKAESASLKVRKSPIRVGGQMSFGKPDGPLACTAFCGGLAHRAPRHHRRGEIAAVHATVRA